MPSLPDKQQPSSLAPFWNPTCSGPLWLWAQMLVLIEGCFWDNRPGKHSKCQDRMPPFPPHFIIFPRPTTIPIHYLHLLALGTTSGRLTESVSPYQRHFNCYFGSPSSSSTRSRKGDFTLFCDAVDHVNMDHQQVRRPRPAPISQSPSLPY